MLPSLAKGRGRGLKGTTFPMRFSGPGADSTGRIPKEPGRGADQPARRWMGNVHAYQQIR